MGKERELDQLQDLQDAYAKLLDVSLLLTDRTGKPLTKPSGLTPLTGLLFVREYADLIERASPFLAAMLHVNQPILYDVLPGIKVALAPVVFGGETHAFIWAGAFMEAKAKELIKEYVCDQLNDSATWTEALDLHVLRDPEDLRQDLQRLEKLAGIVATLLQSQYQKTDLRESMLLIKEWSAVLGKRELQLEDWLPHVQQAGSELQFVGYAQKEEDGCFVIRAVRGEQAESLMGVSFMIGEGFLGVTAVTGESGYWEQIERDPRILFFTQKGIRPHALFCLPVMQGETISGLLFGGTQDNRSIRKETLERAALLSSLFGMQLAYQTMQTSMESQLLYLNSLVEIARAMTSLRDMNRILYILVDMSLHLAKGTASCVVVKTDDAHIQVISRGLNVERADAYGKAVADRYFAAEKQATASSIDPVAYWEEGEQAFAEFPILYHGRVQAVLSVAYPEMKEGAEENSLLMGLVSMAGVALQLVRETAEHTVSRRYAEHLHRSLRQWDPASYREAIEAQELIESFGRAQGISPTVIRTLVQACLIAAFDLDVLRETIPEQTEVLTILADYRSLLEGGLPPAAIGRGSYSYSYGGQLLSLIYRYLKHGKQLHLLRQPLPGYDPLLCEQVVSFLQKREVINRTVALGGSDNGTEMGEQAAVLRKRIREMLPLSVREKEVLELVVQGATNREIAERLYISEHTVKNHLTNIFQKLNVTDRTQAIALVYQKALDAKET